MKNKIVLITLCVSAYIFSQEGLPPKGEHPPKEKIMKMMQEKLNLTADQVVQIKKIDQSFDGEERAIHEQIKALHEKKKALMERKKAEIEKTLTMEQKEKLKAIKEKHKALRENRKEKRQILEETK